MRPHRTPSAAAVYRFNALAARLRAQREADARRDGWQSAGEVLERLLPTLNHAFGRDAADDDDREAA